MGWGKRLHIVQLKLCTLFMLAISPGCSCVLRWWQQSYHGLDIATKSWNFHLLLSKVLLKVMQVPTFVLLQIHLSVMVMLLEEFITHILYESQLCWIQKWHPFLSITYVYFANSHMVSVLYKMITVVLTKQLGRLYHADGATHCGGLYLHHIPLQSPLIPPFSFTLLP